MNTKIQLTYFSKLIFIVLLTFVSSSVAKDHVQNSKENFLTHIRSIYVKLQTTTNEMDIDTLSAVALCIKELEDFKYTSEIIGEDHLQTIEETIKKKKGDCEDFTLYILWKLRQYGVPLQDLGLHIFFSEKIGHCIPLIKFENRWYIIETGRNLGLIFDLYYYKTVVGPTLMEVLIQGFNLTDKVKIRLSIKEGTCSLLEYLRYTEEYLKQRDAVITEGYRVPSLENCRVLSKEKR